MKVKLTNIKCHECEEFEFDEEGVSLILGQSGKGKSTVLQAIYFAFYGTAHKIMSNDKTTCKVVLEYKNLIITRTKNPNKLVVNELSGIEAQMLINK